MPLVVANHSHELAHLGYLPKGGIFGEWFNSSLSLITIRIARGKTAAPKVAKKVAAAKSKLIKKKAPKTAKKATAKKGGKKVAKKAAKKVAAPKKWAHLTIYIYDSW